MTIITCYINKNKKAGEFICQNDIEVKVECYRDKDSGRGFHSFEEVWEWFENHNKTP